MTRTVADSALLMQVLSQSDDRDSMSLPPHTIARDDWDAPVRFVRDLRIGLLMDAGCGLPVEPEVRDAVLRAAQLFSPARCSTARTTPGACARTWIWRRCLPGKGMPFCPTSANGPTA